MGKDKYGIVYTDPIRDPELSLRAKGLYALLATYADKDRKCFPSISTLCNESQVSRRTIQRLIKELKDKNYVKREGRYFFL